MVQYRGAGGGRTAIQVRFIDYGNVGSAVERFLLHRVEDIPEEDLLANLMDVDLVLW